MLRYAITSVSRYAAAAERRSHLLKDAARWVEEGIDFVQLREKALGAGEVFDMACALKVFFERSRSRTQLLINGRADVAAAAGADGVHLRSGPEELNAFQVRQIFAAAGRAAPLIAVSCHTLEEVVRASAALVDLLVFGPVFEKRAGNSVLHSGVGLSGLHDAVQAASSAPVLALGGVDHGNMAQCMAMGAAGVAGIRLFARHAP